MVKKKTNKYDDRLQEYCGNYDLINHAWLIRVDSIDSNTSSLHTIGIVFMIITTCLRERYTKKTVFWIGNFRK